mgnify:CR=1 FL=1
MRISLGILASLMVICVSSVNTSSAEALPPEEGASYRGLEPGVFMTRWLVCGPFPASEGRDEPSGQGELIQAFGRDFLTQHGGEKEIKPTAKMVHQRDGQEYAWQLLAAQEDAISLGELYGPKEFVIAYAWAEIEMDEAGPGLLGIGSDDAVKAWLNGELIHESWTSRSIRPDDDLVPVKFQAGKNALLIKVQNGRGPWGFACRLMNAKTLGEKLVAAVNDGDLPVVRLCLSHGAEVNAKDKYGFTPLHLARMKGHDQVEKWLLAKGADPNVETPPAGTPLGFLDILWDSLKENYPMMEYAGAFDESWHEACRVRIRDMATLDEALSIMDRMLVRRLNDYHTGLSWGGQQHLIGPAVRLDLIEDQIVVIECAEELGMARGDILLEIDGVNAKECFDREFPNAFGATEYARAGSACMAIVEGEPGSQVKLKLRNEQGESYEVDAKRGAYSLPYRNGSVLSSRVINDDFGYIRIRGWGRFSPEEFDKHLEPLRDKPCLILDVRDNGGGSDELAETVIGRFIKQDVVCSISFQRRSGTNLYEKSIMIAEPRGPWCYEGKVAVLTNAGCASACEHFVSGMYEAGALLVGTPTTGACGWSKGIDLPGGVTLRCALTFPLHGKVPSPLHGIEPHHLVTPTIDDIRAGRDTVLEKAIALLNP